RPPAPLAWKPVTSRPHAAPARETVTSRPPAAPAREAVTSQTHAALARETGDLARTRRAGAGSCDLANARRAGAAARGRRDPAWGVGARCAAMCLRRPSQTTLSGDWQLAAAEQDFGRSHMDRRRGKAPPSLAAREGSDLAGGAAR